MKGAGGGSSSKKKPPITYTLTFRKSEESEYTMERFELHPDGSMWYTEMTRWETKEPVKITKKFIQDHDNGFRFQVKVAVELLKAWFDDKV